MKLEVAMLLALAGCVSEGNEEPPPSSGPDAPTFLSFGANVTTWLVGTPNTTSTLKISAVLTDPQGVEDVVGGTLTSSDGATVATFATSSQEGAYEASLLWNELFVTLPAPALNEEMAIALTGRFFDQAGHAATKSLMLTARCADSAMHDLSRLGAQRCSYVDCDRAERLCGIHDPGFDAEEVCRAAFNTSCAYIQDNLVGAEQRPCSDTVIEGDLVYCD